MRLGRPYSRRLINNCADAVPTNPFGEGALPFPGPIHEEGPAFNFVHVHIAPETAVQALVSIVAHHKIRVGWNSHRIEVIPSRNPAIKHPGINPLSPCSIIQGLPIHIHNLVLDTNGIARQADNALGLLHRRHPGIIVDHARPTTRKTRIVAHSQQVVRYDIEQRQPISVQATSRILKHVQSRLDSISCIVISDYAKGVITASLMAQVGRLAQNQNLPLIIDPKVEHMSCYAGATILTPNHMEAQQAAGVSGQTHHAIHDIGHALRQQLGCEAVLVTCGEQGMSLCERSGSSWHIPAMARQVYDVTGAGDTVVSTLALAMSVGATIQEASLLANHAAGVVVGLVGTASITKAQLKEAIQHVHG